MLVEMPGMNWLSTILISRLAGLLYKRVVALWRLDYGANLRQKDPTKPNIKQSLREFISPVGVSCACIMWHKQCWKLPLRTGQPRPLLWPEYRNHTKLPILNWLTYLQQQQQHFSALSDANINILSNFPSPEFSVISNTGCYNSFKIA